MLNKPTLQEELDKHIQIDITDFVKKKEIVDELAQYVDPQKDFIGGGFDKDSAEFYFCAKEPNQYAIMMRFSRKDASRPNALCKDYDGTVNKDDIESWRRKVVNNINSLISEKYGEDLSKKVTAA